MPVTNSAGGLAISPSQSVGGEGDERAAGGDGAVEDGERVGADDAAADVAVAVAGAGLAGGDVAHHRAGVAADLVGGGSHGRGPAVPAGASGGRIWAKKMERVIAGSGEGGADDVGEGGEAGDLGAGGVADGGEDGRARWG